MVETLAGAAETVEAPPSDPASWPTLENASPAAPASELVINPFAAPTGPIRVSHYVLLSEVGRGGMGVVHAAYDERLDRKVALKVLRTQGDSWAQRRLVREAQGLARLSHPNVVQIYEIGEVGGHAFLAMEFIDGVTLRRWCAEQHRTRAELLAVFLAAGRGLAAAHAKGLIHRDFKPDNVMLHRDGRVLVTDFGLVRGDDTSETPGAVPASGELGENLTQVGAVLGTPGYMPPEQSSGRQTDARTDQFSFFSALYFSQRPTARKQGQMREIAGLNSPINCRASPQRTPPGLRGFGENQETDPRGAGGACMSEAGRRVRDSVESASRGGSLPSMTTPILFLESHNLEAAERQLCESALDRAGSLIEAAKLLGVTRHALKRRIVKHKIAWPRPIGPES